MTLKPGDRVWWDDPDDGACSGPHTVQHAVEGDEIISITPDGKGVTEVYANELTPLKKYRVHGYAVVRVPLEVEGKDHIHAMQQYDDDYCRFHEGFRHKDAEWAEEFNGYLVDEDGDEEYEKSEFYGSDGETPAGDRCWNCLRHHKTGEKPKEES